jgi:hypothetical protein
VVEFSPPEYLTDTQLSRLKRIPWFSDLALLPTVAALWLASPFLASTQAVAVVLLELLWIVDFVGRLGTGVHLIGMAIHVPDGQAAAATWALPLSSGAASDYAKDLRAESEKDNNLTTSCLTLREPLPH